MSLRLFAALPIPDHIAERLVALQKGVAGAKWRPRENLHLTLRFFGEVAEPVAEGLDYALQHVAGNTRSFALQLAGAGSFGGADPHTLWIGAKPNERLAKLAADCERAARLARLPPEARAFKAHVTLAYLSNAPLERVRAFETRLGLFASEIFCVDRFGLYSSWTRKSAPSLYRLEAEYTLLR